MWMILESDSLLLEVLDFVGDETIVPEAITQFYDALQKVYP